MPGTSVAPTKCARLMEFAYVEFPEVRTPA